jgi:multidrug resistance efflux pump
MFAAKPATAHSPAQHTHIAPTEWVVPKWGFVSLFPASRDAQQPKMTKLPIRSRRMSCGTATLVLAAAIAVCLAQAGCLRSGQGNAKAATEQSDPAAINVEVAPVTLRPIQRSVQVVGTFEGFEELTVTPKVEGRVVKIYHDVSNLTVLYPGDLLLEIDPTDYQLVVQERARDLKSELAKLDIREPVEDEVEVERLLATLVVENLPTVRRAAMLEKYVAERLERSRQLFSKNVVSKDDLEQLEADYEVARANYDQAVLDARTTIAVARYKASLLATARQRLRDTKIVVPEPTRLARNQWEKQALAKVERPGFVVARQKVSEGEIVRPAAASELFRLVMDNPIIFVASLPERYAGQVTEGQPVQITVASSSEVFQGTVSRVSPTVDTASRTLTIEAVVLNPKRILKAGGFGRAAILTKVDPQAKTVPIVAVVTSAGTSRVFVVDGDKARAVTVTPAVVNREEGWVEVEGNIEPTMMVVTRGNNVLADGTPVRVGAPHQ